MPSKGSRMGSPGYDSPRFTHAMVGRPSSALKRREATKGIPMSATFGPRKAAYVLAKA